MSATQGVTGAPISASHAASPGSLPQVADNSSASAPQQDAAAAGSPAEFQQQVLGVATTVTPRGAGVVDGSHASLANIAVRGLDLSGELMILAWLVGNAIVIFLVRHRRAVTRLANDFKPITLGTHSFVS